MKKIGFVIPWYHKDIKGGAEQELRGIVKHLKEAGVDVEIITTCVKEFTAEEQLRKLMHLLNFLAMLSICLCVQAILLTRTHIFFQN